MGYTFKRPDPAAMERILTRFPYSPEGAILRLAWLEGLSREEIAALTWDQVQFEDNALTLPDRTVPLAPSAEDCLRERHRLYAQRDPHVIISDRYQRPMPPESVSRLARTALDTEGQKVSLKDLRQDFVIRQLQTHDWTYAARVSGMAVSTLRGSFSQYFQERQSAAPELPPDSEVLQQALNEKRGSEVQLYVPQRGDKAHLVEMAHTNAVERLARESGRYAREEKLLDEMAQVLGLSKPPRTIESYDISNWGDGTSVCGMVTFRDGKPYKAGYRKFRMKTVLGTDDYASLAETVSRRAAEYEKYAALAAQGQGSDNYFGQKPDLLLMDGGRGQVSAAKAALAGTSLADVPLYGMVKDDHHRTRAIVDSEGREIAINMNRGTFTFITAIQDETHRFANAYRKQQMRKKSYSSTLTEVPGVGPKTAKALMTQFKSVGAVREATPDQLENTPGVGPQLAQTIYDYFHT